MHLFFFIYKYAFILFTHIKINENSLRSLFKIFEGHLIEMFTISIENYASTSTKHHFKTHHFGTRVDIHYLIWKQITKSPVSPVSPISTTG